MYDNCHKQLEDAKLGLQRAQDRIFDLLIDDDGQAHKEARRYLEKANPELSARLVEQNSAEAQSESSYKKDAERFRKLAVQGWGANIAGLTQDLVRITAIIDMPQTGYGHHRDDVELAKIADAITIGIIPE